MRFFTQAAALAGKRGLAILGSATTVLPLAAYALSRNAAIAVAFLLGFLTLAGLLAAHGFWRERNEAEGKLRSIENTPEFKIDSTLRMALELRETLTHNYKGLDQKQLRIRTGTLVVESIKVVGEYAPAYADDLKTRELEGAGTTRLLDVVNEYYRVLARIRKQL